MSSIPPSCRLVVLALAVVLAACGDKVPPPKAGASPVKDAGAAPAPAKESGFEVTVSIGEAVLLREGSDGGAVAPGALRIGDTLETTGGGQVRVRLPDGSEIELGGDGRYSVDSKEGKLILRVERGVVLSRVTASGKTAVDLEVLSPFGVTRVGRSDFRVSVGADQAVVDVAVGSAVLLTRDGKEIAVQAGEVAVLSRTGPGGEDALPTTALSLDATQGKAEVKKQGEKRWTAAGKAPRALADGDSVRVTVGEVTILSEENASGRVLLQRGALVGVGVSRQAGGVGRWVVPLQAGLARLEASDTAPMNVELAPGVRVEVEPGARTDAVKTATGIELVPTVGTVRVLAKGRDAVAVPAGRTATIGGDAAVAVKAPERAAVTLSTRQGTQVFHAGLPAVSLVWDGAAGPPWRVTVSADKAGTKVLFDGTLQETYFTVKAPLRGALFWTVAKEGSEPLKGDAVFGPEVHAAELSSTKNEVPEGTEKTTVFFQDKPPGLTFTWAPAEGAVSSKVTVYKESELAKPLVDKTVAGGALEVPAGTLTEGHYAWSVTPLGAKGQPLRGGRMSKLEIAYDNGQATLLILSPKNGEPGGAKVPVRGIAPVGARVTVNDVAVPLDAKARFETTTSPVGGRVVFRMLHGGRESVTVRQLKGR